MDCDILDFDFLLWSVLLIHLNRLHFRQGYETFVPENVTEDGILAIQMGSLVEADEELASIGRGSLVRHAHNASGIVSKGRPDLVFKRLFPYRLAPLWLRWRRPGLDHEIRYQPVE